MPCTICGHPEGSDGPSCPGCGRVTSGEDAMLSPRAVQVFGGARKALEARSGPRPGPLMRIFLAAVAGVLAAFAAFSSLSVNDRPHAVSTGGPSITVTAPSDLAAQGEDVRSP